MKTALIISFLLITSLKSFAQEACPHRIVESTGTIYVIPVYIGKVVYFFDDVEKRSHAEVSFNLDATATQECFKSLQEAHPKKEARVARLDFGKIKIKVFKGLEEGEFTLYPEPGGFFHGSTDVRVSYKAKMQIKKAIEEKTYLLTVIGDVDYEYFELERREIAEVSCLEEKSKLSRVEEIHRRLGEVIVELEKLNPTGTVAKEDALDHFMTNCVEFKEVEANSFESFENQLIKKLKLIDGKIPVYTQKRIPQVERVELLNRQESSSLDY